MHFNLNSEHFYSYLKAVSSSNKIFLLGMYPNLINTMFSYLKIDHTIFCLFGKLLHEPLITIKMKIKIL